MTYLDYNASTPVDPRVLEAMVDALTRLPGNPSSIQHRPGQEAAEAIEQARERVGELMDASPSEVVFTSGASEALTLATLGVVLGSPSRPNILVAATEHKATIAAAELASRLSGGEVGVVPVTSSGVVDLDALGDLLGPDVGLVSVMHANNETGVVNPVSEVARLAHEHGALFLCDVTQSVSKVPVSMAGLGADIAAFSSHKLYGPKGAGALVASRHVQKALVPIFPGGGQERGLRGGTQDTASIVGFGVACALASAEQEGDSAHMSSLMGTFLASLDATAADAVVVGAAHGRIPNTVNLRFVGADAEAVMASMPNIAVSTGSACEAASPTVSHVLLAMGLSRAEASECIRVSLGRPTTVDDVLQAAVAMGRAVQRVRAMTAA